MSHRRTLALLDAILGVAESRREKDVLALPVVHDALRPEEALLKTLAEHFGGVYYSIDGRRPGASSPMNRTLAATVKSTLARVRLPISIQDNGTLVEAAFDDHPAPSGGLEVALRLVELLVSADIDHDFVVLSYPLSGLDHAVAGVLWELCGLAVAADPPPRLRTFVPIASGEVDVEQHCRPANPVRLAVHQSQLVTRGDSRDLESAVRKILLDLNQPIVLFLGAGASASAGVRLGDSFRDEALRDMVGSHPTTEGLVAEFRKRVDAEDRWRQSERELTPRQFASRLTLERVLRESFFHLGGRARDHLHVIQRLQMECERALSRTPPGRQALWRLAEILPRLVIVTINFDELIESGMPRTHRVIVTPADFEEHRQLVVDRIMGRSETVPILKLHGTIGDLNSLIADIDATELGLPPAISGTLDATIRAVNGAVTWVWIGCSMRDADLLMWLRGKDGVDEMHEWWVDPLPGESLDEYAQFVRAGQWARLDQGLSNRLVTETSDVFLSRIDERTAALSGRVVEG